jgi:hypothetical protein
LRDRLDRIECALDELREIAVDETRVLTTTLMTVGHPGFRLRRDIPIVIEETDEDATASWIEAGVTAFSESIAGALVAFDEALITAYESLATTPDAGLDPLTRRNKSVLLAVVERV